MFEKTNTVGAPSPAEPSSRSGGRRILLVDDSTTVDQFVRSALPTCNVERLESFVDLPAYLRKGVPEAIILDVEMPGISGQAFAAFLRRCTTADIPIVIYSSVDEARLAAVSEAVGARAALRKTGDAEALRTTVLRLIGPVSSS